ncbi:hypothetical protein MASR2M8_03360 [Opitutaceae bacterium]
MADSRPVSAITDFTALAASAWQQVEVGFCLSDAAGIICSVNPAFCVITGYTEEELVGGSLVRLHPPEIAFTASGAHAAIIAGETSVPPVTYLHKSGRPIFAQISDRRLNAPAGGVFRVTTLVDLEREVSRDARLEQMHRAEHFLSLASSISNDYNNLLAIIMGYTAFMTDSGSDPRRIQTAVQGIDNAVQRAADLVKQTLYITRQSVPALQRIHLNVLLDELARNVGANDSWGAAVELVTEPLLGPAGLDPQHMAYMVNELCRRAYEVMGRGFQLHLRTQRVDGAVVQAKFSHAREPIYACLEIQLAPSTLSPRRASRVSWENRRDLSLASIKSIMAGHRGCVERDQLQGDTVVFRLYFPMLAEPVVPVEPAPTAGVGATILVVDDEDSLLHALGFALERHGFKVLKSRDGVEAVETFERHHTTIALVLCDLGLPRLSGWEAFMRMRQIRPDTCVILMTGQLGHALQDEINRAGAAGFLQKPFAILDAVAQVRAQLDAAPAYYRPVNR